VDVLVAPASRRRFFSLERRKPAGETPAPQKPLRDLASQKMKRTANRKRRSAACISAGQWAGNDSATIYILQMSLMDSPAPKIHLPHWLTAVVASAGGPGLFLIAFLDSSVLTFPIINDLLLINLSIRYPARMPYYAAMATLGSVAGCLLLYYIARKGGEAMFHKHAGSRARHIHAWINRNGFVSILVTALLPPPTPFKVFVVAAGALEMPVRTFVLGLLVARGIRFFGEGLLAVKYGDQASQFLLTHKLEVAGITLGVVLLLYLATRIAFRPRLQ
jgi:membrane protein YqaA with SNARE-associated domain